MQGTKLGEVLKFRYLGAIVTEDGRSENVIALGFKAFSKLNIIWKDNQISLKAKIRFLKAIVTSTVLYGAESWTMTSAMEKKIAAFEMKIFRRLLTIPYTSHKTNAEVKARIRNQVGITEELLTTVKKKKLQWFGHVCKHSGILSNTILEGYVESKRKQGRQDRNGSAMLPKEQV